MPTSAATSFSVQSARPRSRESVHAASTISRRVAERRSAGRSRIGAPNMIRRIARHTARVKVQSVPCTQQPRQFSMRHPTRPGLPACVAPRMILNARGVT